MKINDDFIIESDLRNFVLKYRIFRNSRTEAGTKNAYWEEAYFGRLEQVFDHIITKTLRIQDAVKLEEITQLIIGAKKDIINAIQSSEFAKFMEDREKLYPKKVIEPVTETPLQVARIKGKLGRPAGSKNRKKK